MYTCSSGDGNKNYSLQVFANHGYHSRAYFIDYLCGCNIGANYIFRENSWKICQQIRYLPQKCV